MNQNAYNINYYFEDTNECINCDLNINMYQNDMKGNNALKNALKTN